MRFTKRAALACFLFLGLWLNFGAQGAGPDDRTRPPQTSPFVLPIVKRDSLLNGLQLMTLEQPGSGTVSVHLRLNSGALFDLANKGGLADITAGMLLRGGGGLNAKALADAVEQSGLTVNIEASWDWTDVAISGPGDSLETIFDLLGKLIISPTFDQKELDSLKAARIAALSKEVRDDSVAVRRKGLESVFGSYPFGRPAHGTAESVAQITRQDLVYYYNRFYIANNAAVIVSGDVTADLVTRLGRSKLGAWKKGEKIPPTFRSPDPQAARRIVLLDRSEEQGARASIVQIGFSRRAEDYLPALVMTGVLGSKASKASSTHQGTSIETEVDARVLPGPLSANIASGPGDVAGDVVVVLDAMAALQSAPPTGEAVEAAKTRLIESMAARIKTTGGAAKVLLDIETYGLGRDYVVNFVDRVNAISPIDVQRAAQAYLKPQSVTIVIAGPANRLESPMKKLGTVVVSK